MTSSRSPSPKIFRAIAVSFTIMALWLWPAETHAQEAINKTGLPGGSVTQALDRLQNRDCFPAEVLIVQSELDLLIAKSGGGACPSAAANIAMQGLRVMNGLPPHSNPHKVALEAFRAHPKLLDGRVSNKLLVDLLQFYEKQLDGATLSVTVESAPNSPYATDLKVWGSKKKPSLQFGPDELKIVSYSVSEANGNFLGRHFVLLKKVDGKSLVVVDPTSPQKDKSYRLERGEQGEGRFFLRSPPQFEHGYVNEINTIFTICIHRVGDSPSSLSLCDLKSRIDETAAALKTEGKLRSPREWRKRTAEFGLPALDLPQEIGGGGWNAEQCLEVFRHAGRHDLNLRDVVGGAHSRILLKSKTPQARELLQGIVSGEKYFAITITEPNFGSDFTSMESTSRKVDGGYLLNGTKRFNARLEQATEVIVITKSPENKRGKLNVFVVPIDAPGIEIQTLGAHGLTGNSYGGLTMTDVFVPNHFLIGEDGQGRTVFREHFLYWRLMQTAAAIGTAERALEMMAERLTTRYAFGGPIGRFTHLQQPMGQHTTELKMALSLAKEAARLLDQGKLDEAEPLINGLKAEGVEIALKAVDAATRAFGGEGYSDLVDLGDRLRDLNGLRIADGTTDVMRSDVVRQQFGPKFWKMATEGKLE